MIELIRSSVSVSEGIRQNLDNQKKAFIRNFFTTMQLVMAGNDPQGIRYGTIETLEKYYLEWKETEGTGCLPNDEPGQMLLIVVDKLLTGFDAPSATYLYIDKKWLIITFSKLFAGLTGLMAKTKTTAT